MSKEDYKYLAISGGVGGAKLTLGLSQVLESSQLAVLANTGDDFEHLGLNISPDIDTLVYTLSGLNNTEQGWGRVEESWNFAKECEQLDLDTWFQLGDRDLAMHVYRTQGLKSGKTLTEVTEELAGRFGVPNQIIPMTDSAVPTVVQTDQGRLSFQEYFVKYKCEPKVQAIEYVGAEHARLSSKLLDCLEDDKLRAIVICPSNPFLSIAPVLSIPRLREKLIATGKPLIVVSPIVDGHSLKGPTEKLMVELNLECTLTTIADLYADFATAIVIDNKDLKQLPVLEGMGLKVMSADIIMTSLEVKKALAEEILNFVGTIS